MDKLRFDEMIGKLSAKCSTGANSHTGENRPQEHWYKCEICKDTGFVMVDRNTARICKCQEQKKLERLFKSSQITPAFRRKTFGSFVTRGRAPVIAEMFESAREYADRFMELKDSENNWLVLLGEPGCGKTHLSMAVANQLLEQKVAVLYFQHVEGMEELKDAFRQQKEGHISEKLGRMKKAELLIWDDLFKGRERPTDWVLERVFEVLNYRYLNLLPTVISSEKLPEQLIEMDRAIGSRILERGKGHLVVVEGMENNYRLTGE